MSLSPTGAIAGADLDPIEALEVYLEAHLDRLIATERAACNFVSVATSAAVPITQQNKGGGDTRSLAPQCADDHSTTTPNRPINEPIQTPSAPAHTSRNKRNRTGKIAGAAAGRDAIRAPANLPIAPTRKARRVAARLDHLMQNTWRTLNSAEKAAAAVWHVAGAGGQAVSLNLGIRREGSLLNHKDPRRLFQQHLNKQLNAAGLRGLPYALAFEVTPDASSGTVRLHLHGVVETAHLTPDERQRLEGVFIRAASVAEGTIGGDRQLDMRPIHDASGWIDYCLEDQARTKRELGTDDLWLLSNPMKARAHQTFDMMRDERKYA